MTELAATELAAIDNEVDCNMIVVPAFNRTGMNTESIKTDQTFTPNKAAT